LYSGRTDDFIKLRDLTKINALHVEGLILKDIRVKACVMGGEGRDVPFLLMELVDQEISVENVKQVLWPMIEGIAKRMSSLLRLEKEMIIFTSPEKLIKKVSGKGTINRRGTIEDYSEEIVGLYERRASRMNKPA
jgi:hypothetical protein